MLSQFSHSVMSDSLQPHALQHDRLPCSSPAPGAYSDSCPSHQWCHPVISSCVVPFSSRLQSFPALGSSPVSWFFSSGGQSIGVSASASASASAFLPVNIQDWFPLGLTGWISLQSKGLSRVFSNITVQKHQFFGTQLSLKVILIRKLGNLVIKINNARSHFLRRQPNEQQYVTQKTEITGLSIGLWKARLYYRSWFTLIVYLFYARAMHSLLHLIIFPWRIL